MAEISPLTFFRFAAEHSALLTDIFYNSTGITELDLKRLIIRHRKPTDPSPHHIIEQLSRLGILETVPDATASFEMTRPVSTLMAFLLRQHRLTSVRVIQAYLSDIEHLARELSAALRDASGHSAVRILDEIGEVMERIRQDSRSNRDGIVAEAVRIKANTERLSAIERFETINRLWSRYIEPLRDLIDVRKEMDDALDGLDLLFREGRGVFKMDGAMQREFSVASARLLRLRRDVKADYHESLAELGPLYESLRRDTALARGAGRALEILGRKGLRGLEIAQRLALPVWRTDGLMSTSALTAYLYGIRGYEPRVMPALSEAPQVAPEPVIEPSELKDRLMSELAVDDLLQWLIDNHEGFPAVEIIRAYGRVLEMPGLKFGLVQETKQYQLTPFTVEACPRTVGREDENGQQGPL